MAPANAYAQSANAHTTNDALNNLAAATAADRQAAANQAEAVANLTVSNQNLAQHLQQAQQQLQNMMSTMHSPTTAPGGGYRAPLPSPHRLPPSFPQDQILERLTGTEATNLPEIPTAGTTRTIARRADTTLPNGTQAKRVPLPAVDPRTTNWRRAPAPWEGWKDTALWSAADASGVLIH